LKHEGKFALTCPVLTARLHLCTDFRMTPGMILRNNWMVYFGLLRIIWLHREF